MGHPSIAQAFLRVCFYSGATTANSQLPIDLCISLFPYLTKATIGVPMPLLTRVACDVTSLPTQSRGSIHFNVILPCVDWLDMERESRAFQYIELIPRFVVGTCHSNYSPHYLS